MRGQFAVVDVQLRIERREHGRPDALKAIAAVGERVCQENSVRVVIEVTDVEGEGLSRRAGVESTRRS